jgi:transcriptional regulator with XRE-family HTH domain/transposase-like protein
MIPNNIKIKMCKFCKSGDKTIEDVAKRFNISLSTARNRCHLLHLPVKKKVQKLNEGIIEFCKYGDKTVEDVAKRFNISLSTVRYKKDDLKLDVLPKEIGKVKRNARILKLVEDDDLTYKEIGELFGVTRQAVAGIILRSGYSRWDSRRKKFKAIAKNINNDIKLGLTYKEINEKYTYSTLANLTARNLLPSLFSDLLEKRNRLITKKYKGEIAKSIVQSEDYDLNNPNGINTLSGVYSISSKNGFKKYPKIGRRCDGGTFEDKKILRYIQNKRDKHGWTFKKIAEKLTRLGYKTLTGKEFDMPNVVYKYNAYKKNKYKRLNY